MSIFTLLMAAAAANLQPATEPSSAPADGPKSQVQLVNLVDSFDRFHATIQPLPQITPGPALRAHFATRLEGYYTHERLGAQADAAISHALAKWPEQRETVMGVAQRFEQEFDPALAAFETVFGAFPEAETIFLVHSLGEFDGAVRDLPRGDTLLFGADMIAQIHGDNRLGPLFVHELFHRYHSLNWDGCYRLACALWSEGLAVHVAASLFPDASDGELLLTMPRPIRADVDARSEEAACAVHAEITDQDGGNYMALFSFEEHSSGLPPRFGYYVGAKVAQHLGRDRSLVELAALDSAEVTPLIEAALLEMGNGCR